MTPIISILLLVLLLLVAFYYWHLLALDRRHAALEENNYFKEIFDHMKDGYVVFDQDFHVRYKNKALRHLLQRLKFDLEDDLLPFLSLLSMKYEEPGIELGQLIERLIQYPVLYHCFEVDGKPLKLSMQVWGYQGDWILKVEDQTTLVELGDQNAMLHEIFGKRRPYNSMQEVYHMLGTSFVNHLGVAGVLFNEVSENLSSIQYFYNHKGEQVISKGLHYLTQVYGPRETVKVERVASYQKNQPALQDLSGDHFISKAVRLEMTGKYVFVVVFLYAHQHQLLKETQWFKTATLRLKSGYDHLDMRNNLKLNLLTDQLTHLNNREEFTKALDRAIVRTSLHGKQELILILLDLNGLKLINEKHGFSVGDQLLLLISNRFIERSHGRYNIGRVAGDQFAFFAQLETRAEGQQLMEEIITMASANMIVMGQNYALSCYVGASYYNEQRRKSSDLINASKRALARARVGAINHFEIAGEGAYEIK